MAKSERLLELMQSLRLRRRPVRGAELARELGVSLRTLYRDIAALQSLGAEIEGEAGVGYVLKPGFLLPPLMFSEEEIEALVLGTRWVQERGDPSLSTAARHAISKVAALLPKDLREALAANTLLVPDPAEVPCFQVDPAVFRKAIRDQAKIGIDYTTEAGASSRRVVWPFAIGYFSVVQTLVAWCELRGGFRTFRIDRIRHAERVGTRYPRSKRSLLAEWAREQKIPLNDNGFVL